MKRRVSKITRKNLMTLLGGENNDLLCDTDWHGRLNVPSGSGKRFIINHVDSENSFLSGCNEEV